MTTQMMRTRLTEQYPGSDWAKKVEKMPDDQVQAIFLRLQQSGVIDTKKEKPIHIPVSPPLYTYYCNACIGVFTTNNPDEYECRHCGSKSITMNAPTIKIEKRNNNED